MCAASAMKPDLTKCADITLMSSSLKLCTLLDMRVGDVWSAWDRDIGTFFLHTRQSQRCYSLLQHHTLHHQYYGAYNIYTNTMKTCPAHLKLLYDSGQPAWSVFLNTHTKPDTHSRGGRHTHDECAKQRHCACVCESSTGQHRMGHGVGQSNGHKAVKLSSCCQVLPCTLNSTALCCSYACSCVYVLELQPA